MVILRGIVRNAIKSSDDGGDVPVAGAVIIQLSSAVYTSTNGTFYTSALTLDVATCQASKYETVQYSIPDFATTYDPKGVISGSVTSIDTSSVAGVTTIWDTNKIYIADTLSGRTLTMMDGIDDGITAIIKNNTNNSINLGGVSGGIYSTWECMTSNAAWAARYDHSSVAMPNDDIVIIAGAFIYNDVWKSSNKGATWTCMTSNAAFTVRFRGNAVVVSSDIIYLAGYPGYIQKEVWISHDTGATWSLQTNTPGWGEREWASCVALKNGKIILMGGYNDSYQKYSDVWMSADKGLTWSCKTSSAEWGKRDGHDSVVLSDQSIVLMGGYSSIFGYEVSNDVWRSTDEGATWTCMTSSAAWTPRYCMRVEALSDDSIILTGGNLDYPTYDYTNDVWKSTDKGATWVRLPTAPWSVRFCHETSVLSDDSIILTGGRNPKKDTWKYSAVGLSGSCVITRAVPGDIYNIGGISGESTQNIVFTLWNNKAYSKG